VLFFFNPAIAIRQDQVPTEIPLVWTSSWISPVAGDPGDAASSAPCRAVQRRNDLTGSLGRAVLTTRVRIRAVGA